MIERFYNLALVITVLAGFVVTVGIEASNYHPRVGREFLSFALILGGPAVISFTFWATGLQRLVRRRLLTRDLGVLQRLIAHTPESGWRDKRRPRFDHLHRRLNEIAKYSSSDPAVLETRALLEDMERRVVAAAEAAGCNKGYSPLDPARDLAAVFFGGRAALDRVGQGVIVAGLGLHLLGFVFGRPLAICLLAGFVLIWTGGVVALRRYSVIISVGGSFVLACFVSATFALREPLLIAYQWARAKW